MKAIRLEKTDIKADVIGAKLNKTGLYLECTSRLNYLQIGDILTYRTFAFEVLEECFTEGDEEVVYTLFSECNAVYDEPVSFWAGCILTLMEVDNDY